MIDEVLETIYKEEPHNWPYGLSKDMFKSGSLWEVKHDGDVVGFVGWQERQDAGKRVGYYSVGVLPQHRNNGYAKAALRQMLSKQASGVDEVRAAITASNKPSLALSTSVMNKEAAGVTAPQMQAVGAKAPGVIKHILAGLGGAATGGPGLDNFMYGEQKNPLTNFTEGVKDPTRSHRMLWNSLFGAGAGVLGLHNAPAAILTGMSIPGKDLVIKATQKMDQVDPAKINTALDTASQPASAQPNWWEAIPKPALYGAMALGGAGAGLAGLSLYQKFKAAQAETRAAGAGRVNVKLPRKSDSEHETSLDLPISDIGLTDALRQRLGRDTRRTLYQETRERTRHRKPKIPGKPTPPEQNDLELEAEEAALDKAASIRRIEVLIKSGAAVPSPPQQGTNPAYAMQAQQQAMQQQPSRTQGNPDIQQAQQAAQMEVAQAQQQAQQELAKVQQDAAAQTQQAQQDMAAQQQQQGVEIAKQKTENEVLKMKVAEAESKAKLMEHHHKMKAELAAHQNKVENTKPDDTGDMETTRRILDDRISNIGKLLAKKAGTVPPQVPTPPPAAQPVLPQGAVGATRPPIPGGLSDLNRRADQFVGQLYVPRQIYASSGSPMIDQFMHMGRQALLQTPADKNPDAQMQAAMGADASDMMSQPSLAHHFYTQVMTQVPQQ